MSNFEYINVSIIIPFFNRLDLLSKTINSVLMQTHNNWELLLINDGSTESLEPIEKQIINDKRIRLLHQSNTGVSAARNLGIREATGEYIAFLDSDDLWLPHKLEKQLNVMIKGEYDISHTSYQRINEDDIPGRLIHSGDNKQNLFPQILSSCTIATPTVMIRSKILKEIENPFSLAFHIGEDVCLWIDLSYKYKLVGIDIPLTLVRIGNSTAAINIDKQLIGLSNIIKHIESNELYTQYAQYITKIKTYSHNLTLQEKSWINHLDELDKVRQENAQKYVLKFMPLVSIIIPVYNGSDYLKDAIDSALKQTYQNIEVLVINDGSNDEGETTRIALSYGERIRYFNKKNGGVATALNLGIKNMKGKYFSWLSHDDMYTPNKIYYEISIINQLVNKSTILAGGYKVVNTFGEYLYEVNLNSLYKTDDLKKPLFALLRGGINGCSLLIEKSHFKRVGMFDPALKTTQDYDLWFKMFRFQDFYYYTESNVLSRSHEAQGSRSMADYHLKSCNELWINMMDNLTEPERIQNDGSNYMFYRNIYNFLKVNTQYHCAIEHANQKAVEYLIKEYNTVLKQEGVSTKELGIDLSFLEKVIIPLKNQKIRIAVVIYENNFTIYVLNKLKELLNELSSLIPIFIINIGHYTECINAVTDKATELYLPLENSNTEQISNLLKFLGISILVLASDCSYENLKLIKSTERYSIKSIFLHCTHQVGKHNELFNINKLIKASESLKKANIVLWADINNAQAYSILSDNGLYFPMEITEKGEECTNPSIESYKFIYIEEFNKANNSSRILLNIYSKIKKLKPETELFIVALDNADTFTLKSEYEEEIAKRGLLASDIHISNQREEIVEFYKHANMQIVFAHKKNHSFLYADALTYGVPFILIGEFANNMIINECSGAIIAQESSVDDIVEKILEFQTHSDHVEGARNKISVLKDYFLLNKICRRLLKIINYVDNKTEEKVEHIDIKCDLTDVKKFLSTLFSDLIDYDENSNVKHILEVQQDQLEESILAIEDKNTVISYQEIELARLSGIENSTIWKASKPLRKTLDIIKKILK